MKTMIEKMKFGVLLTGFVFLFSLGSGTIRLAEVGDSIKFNSEKSVSTKVTKYAQSQIVHYFNNSTSVKNESGSGSRENGQTGSVRIFLPITFGVSID